MLHHALDKLWAVGGGYELTSVATGDYWAWKSAGPLARPGVQAAPGDILLAINGIPLSQSRHLGHALAGHAGKEVSVTLLRRLAPIGGRDTGASSAAIVEDDARAGAGRKKSSSRRKRNRKKKQVRQQRKGGADGSAASLPPKRIKKQPLHHRKQQRQSHQLYGAVEHKRTRCIGHTGAEKVWYRDWVSRNRALVAGEDRALGYVHVPDMDRFGFAEWCRHYKRECQCSALLVDLRYNGGGCCSELILRDLTQKAVGVLLPRWSKPEPYPKGLPSTSGVVVILVNEHTASDGEYLAHSARKLGVAKIVGQQTWGGFNAVGESTSLLDGTHVTHPTDGFFVAGLGYALEGTGVLPDVEVPHPPQCCPRLASILEGRGQDNPTEEIGQAIDLQLLEAVRVAKAELDGRHGGQNGEVQHPSFDDLVKQMGADGIAASR